MDNFILILVVVGIPVVLFVGIIMWIKSNNRAMYEAGKQLLDENEVRFEKAIMANAVVISVPRTNMMADARGKMKADFRVEVQIPGNEKYITATSWIVDLASISELQEGESIPVKVDVDDKTKIYPNVSWASFWVYG